MTMTADSGGLAAEAVAGISLQLGHVVTALEAERNRKKALAQCLRQVPILPGAIPASGILDQPDLLAAKTGYHWSLRRAVVTGFTQGTVSLYRNSASGELLVTWPSPGTYTFGRGEMLLEPGDRLVFTAAGLATTDMAVVSGAADCFESWLLADYII